MEPPRESIIALAVAIAVILAAIGVIALLKGLGDAVTEATVGVRNRHSRYMEFSHEEKRRQPEQTVSGAVE